jgi:hypothetical protein
VTVELVPCLLIPEGEDGDERRAVATLAASRDPALGRASITSEGPRRWKIEPPATPESQLCPTRLYLLADDRGDSGEIEAGPRRAMLAVLHGVPGSEERFEPLWSAISDGVEFTGTTDYATMLATGAAEARRLRGRDVEGLKDLPAGQWWLWRRDDGDNLGWSHNALDIAQLSGRFSSVRRSRQTGRATAFTLQWTGDLNALRAFSETSVAQSPRDPADGSMKQITLLENDELTTELSLAGGKPATYKRSVPPQFVPGAWLAMLVPQLRADAGPMILRTDYFPPRTGPCPADPLSLLVSFESSRASGAQPPDERIVTIHVNGSGQMSRWHIDEQNVVTRIDWPDGVTARLSDEKTIRLYFGGADEPWSRFAP